MTASHLSLIEFNCFSKNPASTDCQASYTIVCNSSELVTCSWWYVDIYSFSLSHMDSIGMRSGGYGARPSQEYHVGPID
jgi:hypothetical protein